MSYSYEELIQDLSIGLEIHFTYSGDKYSISNNAEGIYLTKYSEWERHQAFKNWRELLELATVDGKSIREIWDMVSDVS